MSDGGTLPGGGAGLSGGARQSLLPTVGEGRVRVARLQEAGGGQPSAMDTWSLSLSTKKIYAMFQSRNPPPMPGIMRKVSPETVPGG